MYQTKPGMSTGGRRNYAGLCAANFGHFIRDQPLLGGAAATWVTWPIFRPGRGVTLAVKVHGGAGNGEPLLIVC